LGGGTGELTTRLQASNWEQGGCFAQAEGTSRPKQPGQGNGKPKGSLKRKTVSVDTFDGADSQYSLLMVWDPNHGFNVGKATFKEGSLKQTRTYYGKTGCTEFSSAYEARRTKCYHDPMRGGVHGQWEPV